jgi:hypothetical protein
MRGFPSLIAAAFIGFGSAHALAEEPSHWNLQEPSRLQWLGWIALENGDLCTRRQAVDGSGKSAIDEQLIWIKAEVCFSLSSWWR